jgi:hypothetical protein
MWNYFSAQCSPISEKHCCLEGSQVSPLSWYEQRVDAEEFVLQVEWYWLEETEVLAEKPIPVSLSPP